MGIVVNPPAFCICRDALGIILLVKDTYPRDYLLINMTLDAYAIS